MILPFHSHKKLTVTMVQDFAVSANGIKTEILRRGDEVDLPEAVANGLVRDKIAVAGRVEEKKLPAPAPAAETGNLIDAKPAAAPAEKK